MRRKKIAVLFLLGGIFLAACKVDMEITVDSNGAGNVSSTFTTDMEPLYQQMKAQAEKEREKGVVVETGANGPSRFVKTKGRFSRIEELNAANSDLVWSLQKDQRGRLQLNVRAHAGSFGAPVPLSITVHMPGKILEATAGMNINSNSARWQGMYATLSGQGLSVRSETSSFSFPVVLIVILFLLAAIGVSVYFFMSRAALTTSRPSRFCDQCGQRLSPRAKFCEQCGTRLN